MKKIMLDLIYIGIVHVNVSIKNFDNGLESTKLPKAFKSKIIMTLPNPIDHNLMKA